MLHVGGAHGDRAAARFRFAARYERLPEHARRRVAIEPDEHSFDLPDLLRLHQVTGAPVVLDTLHHQINNPSRIPLGRGAGAGAGDMAARRAAEDSLQHPAHRGARAAGAARPARQVLAPRPASTPTLSTRSSSRRLSPPRAACRRSTSCWRPRRPTWRCCGCARICGAMRPRLRQRVIEFKVQEFNVQNVSISSTR